MLTPEELHSKEKLKHSQRLLDNDRYDHATRTDRVAVALPRLGIGYVGCFGVDHRDSPLGCSFIGK